jgi:hypothetical protein
VIASEADLRALYDELGSVTSADGSVSDGGMAETPAVDFARERVIVREGPIQTIAWAVTQNEKAVIGLLGCFSPSPASTCSVDVVAIPSLVTAVESRTCDPVKCSGARQLTPAGGV